MTIAQVDVDAAWGDFIAGFGEYAVSLSYNNHHLGTAGPCYRITSDGEYLRLRGSGISARYGVNRASGARFIPVSQVHDDLDRLHAKVDRKLFGKRFNLMASADRTAFIGYIEHLDHNTHVHVTWRCPEARAKEFFGVVSKAWRTIAPAATIYVKPIHDAGWGRYVTKDQKGASLDAALFVASRPGRK